MQRVARAIPVLAAVSLLAFVPFGGRARAATATGADGDIVYVEGGDLIVRSHTNGTLTPMNLPSSTPSYTAANPSWSPDGTKLAFDSGGSVYSCLEAGGNCVPGSALATGTEPVWSPDGGSIAYFDGTNVVTMHSDGTNQATLATGSDPSWSPASIGKILFVSGSSLKTVPTGGGSTATLTVSGVSTSISEPVWSPDGSTIAFVASDGTHSQLWTVPYNSGNGGTATKITDDTGVSGNKVSPSWSPSGNSIVFAITTTGVAGIYEVTKSGSSYGAPSLLHSGSDTTPDWQAAAPINISAPTITGGGAPHVGDQLTATNGTWQGADATGYAYQWQRCGSSGSNCSDIGGQTSQTYAVISSDLGNTLRVVVKAHNAAGYSDGSTSAVTGVVAAAGAVSPPTNTVYPTATVYGGGTSPYIGDELISTTGSWTGTFPITYSYQWVRCDPGDASNGACYSIPGATSTFFIVPSDLYGYRIRIRITAHNSGGDTRAYSLATDVVGATTPLLTVRPTITGNAVVGQSLSVGRGTWTGAPVPDITYEWRRCNAPGDPSSCVAIPGATSTVYTPVVADIGFTLRVYLTGKNIAGTYTQYTNHTFPVIDRQHFAPGSVSSPTVTGTPQVGLALTATTGAFDGDTPIASALVWQRCDATGEDCRNIAKTAGTLTYTLTEADLGSTVRVAVTATNAYGKAIALSEPTDTVYAPPPHVKGIKIVGTPNNDYLYGTPRDDHISGGGGNDTIIGDGGYDKIFGGGGNDIITVTGPGSSEIWSGPGSDTIYAKDGFKDFIDCGPGRDRAVVDAVDVVKNCEVVQGGTSTGGTGGTGSGSGSGTGSGGSGGGSG